VGQEVAALTAGGAYAEVAVTDAVTVFPPRRGHGPPHSRYPPTALPTAYALIHPVGRLQPGETLLMQGAAGGIGTVVGQLARAAGAGAVYGVVSSAAKAEFARGYGYEEVFVGEFEAAARATTSGRGVDLALGPVGGDTLRSALAPLATYGRLVSFGNASSAKPWQVGQPELYPGALSVSGFSILTLAQTDPAALRALTERAFATVVDGTVSLPVTAEFGLEGAAEAHRVMGARASTGKLLLRVG
jgi:NADPH2:quinone reductase